MKFFPFVILILLITTYGFSADSTTEPTDKEDSVMGSVFDRQEEKFQKSSLRIFGFTILIGIIGYGYVGWKRKKGDGQGSSIKVVAVKPLGQREKVAILEIFGEKIVVGVTAHHVSLLRHNSDTMAEERREVGPKE